jgi:type VI secretion system secreted protein Hcp
MSGKMFLKLEGPAVQGEAVHPDHKGQIEVLSWSHAFDQKSSPLRRNEIEFAAHRPFTFTKLQDQTTDGLLKLCWSGREIEKALFYAYRVDDGGRQVKQLEIEFTKVVIASMSLSGAEDGLATETVSLSYGAGRYRHASKGEEAGLGVSHDLIQQTVK